MSTPPSPIKTRRRPIRKALRVAALVVAVVFAFAWWTIARIPHLEPAPEVEGASWSATYLLVGSDSRADLPEDLDGSFGSFGGDRSDVIILARASGGSLHLMSLPRDLKVEIPGHGVNKINAAWAFGGAPLLAETVTSSTGIAIDHVLLVDFAGFAGLVDAAGGIDIAFPYDARDTKSGLEVAAGTTRIDGSTALAYARSRSYQEFRNGAWVTVDADDIGRTGRQQQALEALLRRVASPEGILRLPVVALTLDDALKVDPELDALDAAAAAAGMWAADVDAATVPVRFSNEGGVSYVVFDGEAATAMVGRFVRGERLAP